MNEKIPFGVLNEALFNLRGAFAALEPYFAALAREEERVRAAAKGGSAAFVELSYDFAVETPWLFPEFAEAPAFRENVRYARKLRELAREIDALKEGASRAEAVAGARAMETALIFYDTVKIAARRDIPGSRMVFGELKRRFPKRRRLPPRGPRGRRRNGGK